MAYLLDTNVISELVKPAPDPHVVAWARGVAPLDLYLSVLTIGEVENGITQLTPGNRRVQLLRWAQTDLPRQFLGRVLPVNEDVAKVWGQITAAGKTAGRVLPAVDGLLVATAMVHRLTLATRNVSDTANRGVVVFDPWTGRLHS